MSAHLFVSYEIMYKQNNIWMYKLKPENILSHENE